MQRFAAFLRTIGLFISPLIASLAAGAVLIMLAGSNPLAAYADLFTAGFSCRAGGAQCAALTALQFATPLIFSGLSAAVALRAGFFSIGQSGQMLLGAAAACWLGSHLDLPPWIHPLAAILGGAAAAAAWGGLAAVLREYIGVNEIIVTLLMNVFAGGLSSLVRLSPIALSARLSPLVPGTKLTIGIFLSVLAAGVVYLYLWNTRFGFEQRMIAQAPRFALFGGIAARTPIVLAMLVSGALAGMGGAVEILGVQYRFVSSFSAFTDFDGLIVAFAGHLHPVGVVIFGFLLGGLRIGAITGLQIRAGIPRELGGALIALMLIFLSTKRFYRGGESLRKNVSRPVIPGKG